MGCRLCQVALIMVRSYADERRQVRLAIWLSGRRRTGPLEPAVMRAAGRSTMSRRVHHVIK